MPWQPPSLSKQWSGNYILKLSPGRRPWKPLLLYRHLLTVSLSKYTNKSLDPKLARVSYVYPSAPFYIIIYKYQGKNVSGFIIIKEVQLKSIYIIDNIYIKLLQSHVAIPWDENKITRITAISHTCSAIILDENKIAHIPMLWHTRFYKTCLNKDARTWKGIF